MLKRVIYNKYKTKMKVVWQKKNLDEKLPQQLSAVKRDGEEEGETTGIMDQIRRNIMRRGILEEGIWKSDKWRRRIKQYQKYYIGIVLGDY